MTVRIDKVIAVWFRLVQWSAVDDQFAMQEPEDANVRPFYPAWMTCRWHLDFSPPDFSLEINQASVRQHLHQFTRRDLLPAIFFGGILPLSVIAVFENGLCERFRAKVFVVVDFETPHAVDINSDVPPAGEFSVYSFPINEDERHSLPVKSKTEFCLYDDLRGRCYAPAVLGRSSLSCWH